MVVADPDGFLLTVCENGYGKRTPFGANTAGDEPPRTEAEEPVEEPAEEPAEEAAGEEEARPRTARRCATASSAAAARACATSAPASATARWSASSPVRDGDDIMLITTQGMVNRTHVSEIRIVGRNTQGVRVMNLNEGDKIASIAKMAREEGEEPAAGESTEPSESPTPESPAPTPEP